MKNIRFLILFLFSLAAQSQKHNLIVGTYTNSCESNGIYVYGFDSDSGSFILKTASQNIVNPSYLALSADRKTLFSVNENGRQSSVSSFSIDLNSGQIAPKNSQDSDGADSCHLIADDQHVIVANYSGGNLAVLKIDANGEILKLQQSIQHFGNSVNKSRQESPHAHMVAFSPDKNYVFAVDLGTDRIYSYKYAKTANKPLVFFDSIPVKTGSGPRHLTFSNKGKQAYLLQELDGTITVYNYSDGHLIKFQETTVVAENFHGETGAAAIKISSDDKFLYATNRGDANSITVFSVGNKGRLTKIQELSCGGIGPRDFTIDPSGKFVLVANQKSNEIAIFSRDEVSGLLSDTTKRIAICAPVCVIFGN